MLTLGSPDHGVLYILWLVPYCLAAPKYLSQTLDKSVNLIPFGLFLMDLRILSVLDNDINSINIDTACKEKFNHNFTLPYE